MDNPEEVLQALDEFQKLRPSEIPRELEDYLCFVAKTGDPIYQWSLIKPLFREKLVRVMTDFYESCPTLDLATSPNLEHFNYDIMKCNLLELLESFANAPFTVQRICELLTAPRKEYNRVDKFMRAIEKNILVVSTKEPGPAARRSENGDSMVNGSVDDETVSLAPPHEVEMDSWVKDCASDTAVPSLPAEDVPLVQVALVAEKLSKTLETPKDSPPLSDTPTEMTVSSFITAAHEINTSDSIISGSHVQNAGGTIAEPGVMHEPIMNEDTSSQPSLDSEDDTENTGVKKLQTTFQARDFVKSDEKTDKLYETKECKDAEDNSEDKSDEDSKSSCDSNGELLEKRPRIEDESPVTEPCQNSCSETIEKTDNSTSESEPEVVAKCEQNDDEVVAEKPIVELNESNEANLVQTIPELTSNSTSDSQSSTESESVKESEDSSNSGEGCKIIVEEPAFEESTVKSPEKSPERIVIEEAMEDDVKANEENSCVPHPIPIIEEPKDQVATVEAIISEVTDYKSEITEPVENLEVIAPEVPPSVNLEKNEPAESMEVDSEEAPGFTVDEPMEQEQEQSEALGS